MPSIDPGACRACYVPIFDPSVEMATAAPTLLSASQFQKRFSACLGAALEAWAHMLLYQRRVYPSATFTASTFLGVRSYVSRHPSVVSYITDTLKVVVPSLVSGVATELALTIVDLDHEGEDDGSAQELERYVLRFHFPSTKELNPTMETIDQIERGLRDLVLAAHALEHGRSTEAINDDSGVSFRLSLHVPEKDQTCAELNEAFATGAWYAPSAGAIEANGNESQPRGRVVRPLHQFSEAAVGSVQFAMLKRKKNKNKARKDPP